MNNFKEKMKLRTLNAAVEVLRLCDKTSKTASNVVIVNQLSRSITSVGANYRAACRAKSRPDFVSKMQTVEEECDESMYWVEMLASLNDPKTLPTAVILKELNEILSIVVTAIKTAKGIG